MDVYQSLFSSALVLNEQVAQQIFKAVPEQGVIIVVMDRAGNSWTSDPEAFDELNISESFLAEICCRIDDGVEPVIAQASQSYIIASQLATERSNCGYVIIALPQDSSESTLINMEVIEMLLNQIVLIVELIENNNLLYESRMKCYFQSGHSEVALN